MIQKYTRKYHNTSLQCFSLDFRIYKVRCLVDLSLWLIHDFHFLYLTPTVAYSQQLFDFLCDLTHFHLSPYSDRQETAQTVVAQVEAELSADCSQLLDKPSRTSSQLLEDPVTELGGCTLPLKRFYFPPCKKLITFFLLPLCKFVLKMLNKLKCNMGIHRWIHKDKIIA